MNFNPAVTIEDDCVQLTQEQARESQLLNPFKLSPPQEVEILQVKHKE